VPDVTRALRCRAIVFLKVWRRRESSLAIDWHTWDVEERKSLIRPLYEERAPTVRNNPISGEVEPFIPAARRCLWIAASVLATLLMLLVATFCLIALVVSRIALYGGFKVPFESQLQPNASETTNRPSAARWPPRTSSWRAGACTGSSSSW